MVSQVIPSRSQEPLSTIGKSYVYQTTEIEAVTKITNRYRLQLEDLKMKANEQSHALLQEAMNEYQSYKQQGKTIPYMDLYTKYYEAAKEVEKNIDESFQDIYSALETELEENGYSGSHAIEFKKREVV